MSEDLKATTPSAAALKARARRVNRGEATEAEARKRTTKASLQGMLQLPLLEALEEAGGKARPRDLYQQLATRLGVPDGLRQERRTCGDGQSYRVFDQQVRWARQTAVMEGLIADGTRGVWELADPGHAKLLRGRRGVTLLIYSTDLGVALWAHAEDAASVIEPESVDLILTSPPYPVVTRDYGRMDVPQWLDWMRRLTALWRDLLTDTGTLALNLGDVHVPGSPALSPYVERYVLSAIDECGLHLAGRMPWFSPTRIGNIQWTSKAKVRPKRQVEHVVLLSKAANPSWDITRLPPVPFSPDTHRWWERKQRGRMQKRPSDYDIREEAFEPKGAGALPGNLIVAAGAPGMDAYSRRCRAAGLPRHSARFPAEVPRSIILTCTAPGETVYDPMAGSNVTGSVAQELGRHWISSEVMLRSVQGSAFRFDNLPGFSMKPLPPGVAP
ncbi:DNA methyltransferase [Azospirillum aestuarii]|uniref:DNA methyltransferase n=1 Tax=Azospirillum aestuarii TaxID=2802052 RepID=UPI0040550A7F